MKTHAKTRRRNADASPKKSGSWAWAVITGSIVGGAIAYTIVTDAKAQALLERGRQIGLPLRLPQPGFAMQLPMTREEFEVIEQQLCGCIPSFTRPADGDPTLAAPGSEAPPTLDELVDHMVSCTAHRLYPTFPWPPIAGDNPSVSVLWGDLRTLARHALANDRCTGPLPNPSPRLSHR